jgi:hypothetical protein
LRLCLLWLWRKCLLELLLGRIHPRWLILYVACCILLRWRTHEIEHALLTTPA